MAKSKKKTEPSKSPPKKAAAKRKRKPAAVTEPAPEPVESEAAPVVCAVEASPAAEPDAPKDKAPCRAGDRIRMVKMVDDPDPIPPGATGVVQAIRSLGGSWGGQESYQIDVAWDAPYQYRYLMLSIPPDIVERVEPAAS